jgi:IS5 family transposase
MAAQPGFFDADERLRALSAAGNPLERLKAVVDFELFRPELKATLQRADRSRGGRPAYDAVLMFRILVLQTLYTLSDDQTEYQIRDRLSFMRFVGLSLHEAVPDAKTIWLYREQLTKIGALKRAFDRFDAMLRERGYLAMGGQIVDATVIEARRPRLNAEEKTWCAAAARHRHGRRHARGRSTALAAGPSSAAASGRDHLARHSVRLWARSRCRCSAIRTTSAHARLHPPLHSHPRRAA